MHINNLIRDLRLKRPLKRLKSLFRLPEAMKRENQSTNGALSFCYYLLTYTPYTG